MLTNKERIKKAFRNNGEPDRVPIEPGLDFDTLTDLSGLDYFDYADRGHTELKDLILWTDRLSFDLYYFAAGIPEPNPPPEVMVVRKQHEKPDLRVTETVATTKVGTIRELRRQPRRGPAFAHEKFVKDIRRDWPALKEYWGADWRVHSRYADEYARAGDRGAVGVVVHSPIDWWQEYRNGGIEQVIYDLYDHPKLMEEVFEFYSGHAIAYLTDVSALEPQPDFVMIHGSNCSASVLSPEIFDRHVLPFVEKTTALLKCAGIPSLFHVCGKSRDLLDSLAGTDLNVIDALERPPAGNVDLAEVKKRYGGKLCLKGNVLVNTMVFGTVSEVRDEVKRCIDSAAEGGGFMLAVGDSIGPKANRANIEEMVKAALEYGS